MRYKQLPQTDLSPSVLALGTVSFGTDIDSSTAFHFLDTFFEYGARSLIPHMSTAPGFLVAWDSVNGSLGNG
jgi:hypothetical protein